MAVIVKIKDKYKDYLQTREGIDGYNLFKNILYSNRDSLSELLCKNYVSKLSLPQTLSVCDIGGGDGKRIVSLSKCLHRTFGTKIKLDFIEQSKLMCNDFEKKLDEISSFSGINIYASEIEKTKLTNTYDLIFFIHSIFCLPNFEEFTTVSKKLKESGLAIVVSNSSDSFLARLKFKLDTGYDDKRYEISELKADLEANNIHFEETTFDTKFSISENEINSMLTIIIDWLSLGEWKYFDSFKKIQLLEFAKGFGVLQNGSYNFNEREELLIVSKSSIT